MKRFLTFLCALTACIPLCAGGKKDIRNADMPESPAARAEFKAAYRKKIPDGEPVKLSEVWGWVMQGKESELDFDFPLTDIGYFAADVDTYGKLDNIPDRNVLSGFPGRVHLVLVCDSKSLTHFILDPAFGLRDRLIADILAASEPFDGIQVDYELIPGKDSDNFMTFLKLLSAGARKKGKLFSVCVPARVKTISDDTFSYPKIAELSDRVMIMAYDEHWSTSLPGPIASVSWCEKIAGYALTVIPPEKLVMGLPFYGRSWANEKTAQGWYFSGINRIIDQYDSGKVEYVNDIPTVDIKMDVNVTCWFEDTYSTVQKLRLYTSRGISYAAFWRIGQEDPEIWQWITLLEKEEKEQP